MKFGRPLQYGGAGRTGLHHTHTHALVYTIQSDIHDGINL